MTEAQIVLRASDGETLAVPCAAARLSSVLRSLIEDHGYENGVDADAAPIEIPNIDKPTLRRVFKFCKRYAATEEQSAVWDAAYVEPATVTTNTLLELLRAANFLDIRRLMTLISNAVAARLRGKTTAEIRAAFGLPDDLTATEKAAIDREHAWCVPAPTR